MLPTRVCTMFGVVGAVRQSDREPSKVGVCSSGVDGPQVGMALGPAACCPEVAKARLSWAGLGDPLWDLYRSRGMGAMVWIWSLPPACSHRIPRGHGANAQAGLAALCKVTRRRPHMTASAVHMPLLGQRAAAFSGSSMYVQEAVCDVRPVLHHSEKPKKSCRRRARTHTWPGGMP